MTNNYSDIPEDTRAKPYFPLLPVIWQFFKEMGWTVTEKLLKESEDCAYYFFEDRLNESILTSELVVNGKMDHPEKVLSYVSVIPPLPIRADLTQGTHKLLGGESFDVVWVGMNDLTQEISLCINAHCEDGVPVDWWLVKEGDDLLERRHMKYGWKIRELPKKLKNLTTIADRTLDILRDVRNERTPEWATSDYIVAPVWVSYGIDMFLEGSNFETVANSWEGWASKDKYKLPDYMFSLNPMPVILSAMMMGGRKSFTSRTTQLTAEGHLYCQAIEERTYERFLNKVPEIVSMLKVNYMERGIPFPIQTLDATMPNVKNKSDPGNRFKYKYDGGEFIKPEAFGLEWDEMRKGIFFDITAETPPDEELDESKILSMGVGSKTKYR